MTGYNWDALKHAFITDPKNLSVRAWARAMELKEKTVSDRATKDKWLELRATFLESVGQETTENVSEYTASQQSATIVERLSEIRRMQEAALKSAGGSPGSIVSYEKPHEAVAAYERLVKLERLLTDQSTENLNVSDGRQIVTQLFQIIREEIGDTATLERIAARLSELGGATARVSRPADGLN